MDRTTLEEFRRQLRAQRARLLNEVETFEQDLKTITTTREAELEEAAQEERAAHLLAQLDARGKAEVEAIDRALARIVDGTYGVCALCGSEIGVLRLRALPATPYCRDCAERVERGEVAEFEPEPTPRHGPVPADYSLLTDRELEEAVREHLREDGRIDMDELRIVCRHGVVYLDGAVPSHSEHQILLHTITDIMGLNEIVDRLQIKEILWEREDREKEEGPTETQAWEEPEGTEDVVEVVENGADFVPPWKPVPEEE